MWWCRALSCAKQIGVVVVMRGVGALIVRCALVAHGNGNNCVWHAMGIVHRFVLCTAAMGSNNCAIAQVQYYVAPINVQLSVFGAASVGVDGSVLFSHVYVLFTSRQRSHSLLMNISVDAATKRGPDPIASAQPTSFFFLAVCDSGQPRVFSSNGVDVSDAFPDVVKPDVMQMLQWMAPCTDGRIAFWGQGAGIGFVDFEAASVVAPPSCAHIGDEFGGVCESVDGHFWVCGADYGRSYGVVVDASGHVVTAFGTAAGGSDDDAEERSRGSQGNGADEEAAPISVASLSPFSSEVAVSNGTNQLVMYNLDGSESRRLTLPLNATSFGMCCVQRDQVEAPLIAVIAEIPTEMRPPAADGSEAAPGANRRHRKVFKCIPTRHVLVIDAVSGALMKEYKDVHLGGGRGNIPVALAAMPDRSIAVTISEDLPLRVWPADQGLRVKPLLSGLSAAVAAPRSGNAMMGIRMVAAVPASDDAVLQAERATISSQQEKDAAQAKRKPR